MSPAPQSSHEQGSPVLYRVRIAAVAAAAVAALAVGAFSISSAVATSPAVAADGEAPPPPPTLPPEGGDAQPDPEGGSPPEQEEKSSPNGSDNDHNSGTPTQPTVTPSESDVAQESSPPSKGNPCKRARKRLMRASVKLKRLRRHLRRASRSNAALSPSAKARKMRLRRAKRKLRRARLHLRSACKQRRRLSAGSGRVKRDPLSQSSRAAGKPGGTASASASSAETASNGALYARTSFFCGWEPGKAQITAMAPVMSAVNVRRDFRDTQYVAWRPYWYEWNGRSWVWIGSPYNWQYTIGSDELMNLPWYDLGTRQRTPLQLPGTVSVSTGGAYRYFRVAVKMYWWATSHARAASVFKWASEPNYCPSRRFEITFR